MKPLIIMGSASDEPVMSERPKWLNWFGIEYKLIVASAHRIPGKIRELVVTAREKGFGAVIAAAGKAGARNAAVPAARIFALSNRAVAQKVEDLKPQEYKIG